MYEIIWKTSVNKDLKQLSNPQKLTKRIESYLSQSPRELGKPLAGEYKGLYRYRYGDYRIIYKIDNASKQVTILQIGHRKEVYD
jgi:mRNA interferase RelE/StbE